MNPVDEEVQMKLLQIDSSARTSSVTRRLTARFAEEWQKHHPDGQVIYRDLAATTLPPITDDWGAHASRRIETDACAALVSIHLGSVNRRTAGGRHGRDWRADVQFLDPSLKAWIDQVVRIGKTFG